MIVPNSNGYTLFHTDVSDMNTYTAKLLFQHKSKDYYYLFDRLMTEIPELKQLVDLIKGISPSWFMRFKGRTITFMLKAFITFAANPQQYGHYADYLFAANYTKLRFYFQKIIKVFIKRYGLYPKKYKFELSRDRLFYMSRVFAHAMLDDCVAMVPRYKLLISKQSNS